MSKMIDGIVYKLFCKDFDEFYIGSTTNFHHRKIAHKSICNNEKDKAYNKKLYKYIRNNGQFDEWEFEILELGEYENDKYMKNRERYFIETLKPSLNSNIPNRTHKEWCIDEYEKVQASRKKYNETHREKIKEQMRVKITCENCNCEIILNGLKKHQKTKKCIQVSLNKSKYL